MVWFMMKKNFKYLILFFVVFSFFLFISIIRPMWCDEVWVYGFCHNISKGMLIYRDFNVLQMPLYFFVSSFFLFIFGDYVVSTHIFDCILIGFLFLMIYKEKGINSILVLLILAIGYSGYNLLTLFLFMTILFFIDEKKDNDFLIGILVGLIFITKQNIGFALFLPYIYYSKKKLSSIFYFFIPFLIISFYFILNSSYFSFLNCVFGSMLDFNQHNKKILFIFVLMEIFVIIHLIFLIKKTKLQDKRLVYALFFQVISYPIFDDGHLFLALFPYAYLLFDYDVSLKKYYFLSFLVFYSLFSVFFSSFHLSFSKNAFYLRNDYYINYSFLNDFSEISKNYDNYYIFSWYAYVFKFYHQIPINQYDFLLSGNCGYDGVNQKIKEIDQICRDSSCVFGINKDDYNSSISQWGEVIRYVRKNYQYIGSIDDFYLFGNEDYVREEK